MGPCCSWLVCLFLVTLLVLFSIFVLLSLMLGVVGLQLVFVVGLVFKGGPRLDVHGSLQLLNSSHVRERDKALLRSIMVGGVWNGFLLERVGRHPAPCRFCTAPDSDGHLFGDCTFPALVEIRESPEFHDLIREDKAHWPRCLLWHGWLPMLSGTNRGSPWAANASEAACYMVEAALGRYSSHLLGSGVPLTVMMRLGLLLPYLITPISGLTVVLFWIRLLVFLLLVLVSLLILQSLCSLFRGLRCRVSFWLCSLHLLFIWRLTTWVLFVMFVGRLLGGCPGSIPFELVNDGDLLLLIDRMLHLRGRETVRTSKVKGHADEGMVLDGRVGEADRLGNDAADEAADFSRRRVGNAVIDARRNLAAVCGRWNPVLLDLHRFFIAISRAVVNHDGREGTVPEPSVWSAGARPKRRRLVHAAFLPRDRTSAVSADEVAQWPKTPVFLVKCVSFL